MRRVEVVEADAEIGEVPRLLGAETGDELLGGDTSWRALSIVGVPCVSLAQT
jgi:hypothetical protein